ncbi:hypothetical protein ACH5RR_036243 [Cinchona calisaya]|uniref:Uncharacterized protein n=1 Tax=Cinchona calisaya TaxID=153742 RepID=A0ABD2Y2M4_9GENT
MEPLSLLIAEYVEAEKSDDKVVLQIFEITVSVFGIYHKRSQGLLAEKMLEMLEQVSQVSEQVNFIASELMEFIEQTRTAELKTSTCWMVVVALDILLDSHFLMEEITFFREVIMRTMFFYQDLQFFLTILEDSSNTYHDPPIFRSLENVADRARNVVEDCMMDNPIEWEMKYFLDVVINIATHSLEREINLEKVVRDIFDGQEGISQYLFQTSEEIHYI